MNRAWESWLREQVRTRSEHQLNRPRKTHDRSLLSFSDNDYLGLSQHPEVVEAALQSLSEYGLGARSSALVAGRSAEHQALELELAEAKKTEAALLFPSGFAANLALLSSLADADTSIFSDALNHASIVDGCRLARERKAKIRVFAHADLNHLEEVLKVDSSPRKIVVVESVFSMDGDLIDLEGIVALKDRYGFLLVVDEAHALGVIGPGASGLTGALELQESVDVQIGTMSKALGCHGGFLAGPQSIVEELWHQGRPQVFSTALPAPIIAATRAALRLIHSDRSPRGELDQRRTELSELLNFDVVAAICPVVIGDSGQALSLSAALQSSGFLVPAIRPPTVPIGTSRLRISLSARHSSSDIQGLAAELRRQLPDDFFE